MSIRMCSGADQPYRTSHYRGAPDCCSFCGGISQEDFFRLVNDGAEVGPTDKNYKVYVRSPNPFPDHERIVSATARKPTWGDGWIEVGPQEREHLRRDGWRGDDYRFVLYMKDKELQVKFYFDHLDEDGRAEFVRLYNDRTMKLGFPGYFYRRPFFAVEVSQG